MFEKSLDYGFFRELLAEDSTSGRERTVAEWLAARLPDLFPASNRPALRIDEVGDGTLNLLFTWGEPQVVFCTHMDTVPPYIAPSREGDRICGRGSCDAKGQLFAMLAACRELADAGRSGFGLLLLAGEETGSWGAKAFAKTGFRAPYLIVGEPTDNCMVSASKGTKSYDLLFRGSAFHSGYPDGGVSAVELFIGFCNELKAHDFGEDPELGMTTWNIGLLRSDNPQNILSPELRCRIFFRTTFRSDAAVQAWMALPRERLEVTARGGDTPLRYLTLDGFPAAPAAFGSDAPHLTGFAQKIICGPGSIRVAHREEESILTGDLEQAVDQYVRFYYKLLSNNAS